MSKLTIVIDNLGHKELRNYLMSLKGIFNVKIKNIKYLEIYLEYDSNLITPSIIKMEILLFLDIFKTPSILSFNKYPKFKTFNYTIIRDDICCEYCLKGAINDLFEIEGIESAKSNFDKAYFSIPREKIMVNIKYNPNLIDNNKIKQIESELNI